MNPAAILFLAAGLSNPIDRVVHPERWQTTPIPPIAMRESIPDLGPTLRAAEAFRKLEALRASRDVEFNKMHIEVLQMEAQSLEFCIQFSQFLERIYRESCKQFPKEEASWQEKEKTERESREKAEARLKVIRNELRPLEKKQQLHRRVEALLQEQEEVKEQIEQLQKQLWELKKQPSFAPQKRP